MTEGPALPPERDLPPGRRLQLKEHLVQQLDQLERAPARPPRPPWRPRPLLLAVGAAAFVAAAIVAVGLVPGAPHDGRSSLPGQGTPAYALERAAVAAERAPDRTPGPGGFWYQRTSSVDVSNLHGKAGAPIAYQVPAEIRVWIGADGSARQLLVPGKPSPLGPANRGAWVAAGRPRLLGASPLDERVPAGSWRVRIGATELTPAELRAFPTDAKALTARIRELARAQVAQELGPQPPARPGTLDAVDIAMFEIVGGLLEESPAPPALRAALFRALARFPDVRAFGTVTDPAGRKGVAVALTGSDGATTGDGARIELVFDPDTSALLTERSVAVRPLMGVGPGTVFASKTYLDAGVVASDHATP